MKIDTLIWLQLVVFMIHDFEEIIFFHPFLTKNKDYITKRFPKPAKKLLSHFEGLSTSSYAFVVAEEFIILSIVTILASELNLFSFFAGILMANLLHLIIHIIQFIVFRRYVPVIVTSVLTSTYFLYALYFLGSENLVKWSNAAGWAVFAFAVIAVNMAAAQKLAVHFEHFLKKYFYQS